ncbi:hypothetical protein M3T53_04730 [Actinomyces sp. B33]|uniref:hypothetical protein n=1 Tax=Actinomyces sp. B33 TaxID=2942131 RepID=UPI00234113F7|nr:hypothetical protein [Actinomyces sp. B33]MDC4233016.1 hypothetical protein [Actinomyces sp. B33]
MPYLSPSARPRRALLWASVLPVASLLLGSCSALPDPLTPAQRLPALSGAAAVRDRAARTEDATASRAARLRADVDESACIGCAAALDAVASGSQERVEALGGMWDPWPQGPPDGVEPPAPSADAPMGVGAFVSWLVDSAERDLDRAADPAVLEGDQARVLALVALSRYESALVLADAYGLPLGSGEDDVRAAVARQAAVALADPAVDTWGLEALASGGGALLPAVDYEQDASTPSSEHLSAAIGVWDCVAQSLPRAEVVDEEVAGAVTTADLLLRRVDDALSSGAADTRVLRCSPPAATAAGLAAALIDADLSLLDSDSRAVRLTGVHAALDDVRRWRGSVDLGAALAPVGAAQSGS